MSMVNLTQSAKDYLKSVGKPNVSLSINSGGCSGFQYLWDTTDKNPTVENLWIDPIAAVSYTHLTLPTSDLV